MLFTASVIAFVIYGFAFVVLQSVVGTRSHARNIRRDDSYARLLLLLLLSPVMYCAAITMKDQPIRPVTMAIGGLITIAGLYVSMWAQQALGRFWVGGVGLHKQHMLITSGPFRYVRHPLYSGMLLSTIGLGVFSWNIFFMLAVLCFTGGFLLRIPAEERLLRQKFKRRYESYAATTGMLVPKFNLRKEG